MNTQFFKDTFGWGFVLWLVGFLLGAVLFISMSISLTLVNWIIMPIGVIIALWVLIKKIEINSFGYFLILALIWTLIAVILDYIFLEKILKPEGGFYKLEVYIHYILTLTLPIIVWFKNKRAITIKTVNTDNQNNTI